MENCLQVASSSKSVASIFQSIQVRILTMMITLGRKNSLAMSREHGISYQKLYKTAQNTEAIPLIKQKLFDEANSLQDGRFGKILSFDFTAIRKPYSQCIEGVTYDRDGCSRRAEKCFSLGFLFLGNGSTTIPLDYTYWFRKKDVEVGRYRKKVDLTMEIMTKLDRRVPYDIAIFDGAFAQKRMFDFLEKQESKFIMRIPKNRNIITVDGVKALIKNHPSLTLVRNERYKTVAAECAGRTYFITAHKRRGKKGKKEVVYLISNIAMTPKDYVEAYKQRWGDEKFF